MLSCLPCTLRVPCFFATTTNNDINLLLMPPPYALPPRKRRFYTAQTTTDDQRCVSRTFLYVQSIVFVLTKKRAKHRVHELASFTVFFCWNAYLCSHLQVLDLLRWFNSMVM